MSSYFTRFKILWDELVNYQSFGGTQQSQSDAQLKDHVFHFLMGLNDSYGHVRTQILIIEPLPNISKVCSLILQEEKHRQISQIIEVIVEPTTLYMTHTNFKGNQGHQSYQGGRNQNY